MTPCKVTDIFAVGWLGSHISLPSEISAQLSEGAQRLPVEYSLKLKQERPARLLAASRRLVFSVPGGLSLTDILGAGGANPACEEIRVQETKSAVQLT